MVEGARIVPYGTRPNALSLNDPARTSNVVVMVDLTESSYQPAHQVEQLTGKDHLYQILCGTGIASGLALLWALETMRNIVFRLLNALKIPARRHKRGSAFPAGPKRA
jgi:hypothetical protein